MKLNLHFKQKPRIEMLPLIDIVFLLLVFFIYAMLSMAVHKGLPVTLPTSATAHLEKKLILAVTVKSDGTVFVDQQPVKLEKLTAVLSDKPASERQKGVLLFADKNLPYQTLFNVLDQLKKAGIAKISLQAENIKQP